MSMSSWQVRHWLSSLRNKEYKIYDAKLIRSIDSKGITNFKSLIESSGTELEVTGDSNVIRKTPKRRCMRLKNCVVKRQHENFKKYVHVDCNKRME